MGSGFADPTNLNFVIRGKFSLTSRDQAGWVNIFYELSPERYEAAEELDYEDELPVRDTHADRPRQAKLLSVNAKQDEVMIFPVRTIPGDEFLKPKYRQIEAIILEGFGLEYPEDPESVAMLLSALPSGFIKDPDYGLGLLKDYRFIIDAVGSIPGVKQLKISQEEPTHVQGDTYVLNFHHYDGIRKAIKNTHKNALNIAAADKRILAYNSLLHKLDGNAYPEKHRTYTDGTIYKVVEGGTRPKLHERDQLAALELVTQNRGSLGEKHPEKLIRLNHEIELVTLEQLIRQLEGRILTKSPEAKWQRFFVDNPFILSLAFGLPIVAVGERASVGGRTFSGGGEKIADFLFKNRITDNLTLVEIKTPHTKLTGKEYRGGVYAPASDLVGGINQALDQRHKIQAELNALKANSEKYDLQSYAIKCVVVAGTSPVVQDQKKSLELFRNNLHDVLVITFDELVEKLRNLHRFLSADLETSVHSDRTGCSS